MFYVFLYGFMYSCKSYFMLYEFVYIYIFHASFLYFLSVNPLQINKKVNLIRLKFNVTNLFNLFNPLLILVYFRLD